MPINRRHLIQAAAAGTLALAAGRLGAVAPAKTLLILGGTGFIGPHLTEQALSRGWQVTHFNRGRRDADVEGVETLTGDRKGELDSLRGRQWDAVIDNTGYIPKFVKMSSELLKDSGYCLFISSISAYASFAKPNDEDSPLGVLANIEEENVTNDTYGPMKVLCERYVQQTFGKRSCIVRPGYIVGPLDPTDRFTYWPVRYAQGGVMAAPGTPADPIQFIDVRDLVRFMMDLVDRRANDVFNADSAPGQFTLQKVFDSAQRVSGARTEVTWIDEDFLAANMKPEEMRFAPWSPMKGEDAGGSLTSTARAQAAGLSIRALDDTVRDTLAWHATRPEDKRLQLRSGLSAEREAELLAAWAASKTG